jgi:GPN-loop GTPase
VRDAPLYHGLFHGGSSSGKISREYLPELARAKAAREETLQAAKADSMGRLMKDLAVDRARSGAAAGLDDKWEEDNEADDDDGGGDSIIDRSTSLWNGERTRVGVCFVD